MALEVLSGPYPITFDGTAAASFANVEGASVTWLQGVGLYCTELAPFGETSKVCVVQVDGVAHRRSPGSLLYTMLDLRSQPFGLAIRDNFSIYALNYLASMASPTPFLTAYGGGFIGDIRVVCQDRFLSFSGATVYSSPLTDGVNFVAEYAFVGSGWNGFGCTVSPGRTPYEICLSAGGQLRFYDTKGKTQTDATRWIGSTPDACVYVKKWGVFVTVASLEVSVLADAPRPYAISNPTLAPAATAGEVSVATVQVTGAQGEPCPGELVDWTIASGAGSLSASQTETDESGYASVNYIVPIGSSGSATPTATIAF